MPVDAYNAKRPEPNINYLTDGKALNSCRLKGSSREEDVQRSAGLIALGCSNFGLATSTKKAVFLRPPAPNADYS
ncbi:unnamed protein product [Dibothriocephalus latus]|uniref:Uncharacterized protein n=1 Tax=Dibothriocephalus latus TaxID=60516 RepID=A0A3P6QRW1_DIBLA|nr:unnamed protein product [Dibothriocephalus latus]